jgi:hypothetical protein
MEAGMTDLAPRCIDRRGATQFWPYGRGGRGTR